MKNTGSRSFECVPSGSIKNDKKIDHINKFVIYAS